MIKGEIRQQQMKEGTAKLRAKRNFGNKIAAFVDASQGQLDDVEVIQEALDNLDCVRTRVWMYCQGGDPDRDGAQELSRRWGTDGV